MYFEDIYLHYFRTPLLFIQLGTAALRLIIRSGLDVPTSATRRHHARAPSGGRWNCGREMSGKFCLNSDFHVTFRDLLHALDLRHGTDGFTSSPKEGVLRIFSSKNPTASAWCEPTNLGTKGQHATSRPPKPLGGRGGVKNDWSSNFIPPICFHRVCKKLAGESSVPNTMTVPRPV